MTEITEEEFLSKERDGNQYESVYQVWYSERNKWEDYVWHMPHGVHKKYRTVYRLSIENCSKFLVDNKISSWIDVYRHLPNLTQEAKLIIDAMVKHERWKHNFNGIQEGKQSIRKQIKEALNIEDNGY